mgnify:FL=1|tara:strand:- start:569 stop:1000 length:432 start_codon:yes stop_codon:yes gene_type:complete
MIRYITLTFLLFFFNFIFSQNFSNLSSPNSLESLQGQIPGLTITPGYLGDSPNVLIRGYNTWNNNGPLYVIDGLQTQDAKVFNSINFRNIQSVSVLKDASAAIYGSRGSNGVIIVKTKRGGKNYANNKSVRHIKKKKKNRNLN